MKHVSDLCTESYEAEALGVCVAFTDERTKNSYEGKNQCSMRGVVFFL